MSEKKISDFFTAASERNKRCLSSPEADNQCRRARVTTQVTNTLGEMGTEKVDLTHNQLKELLSSLLDEKLVNIVTKQDLEDITSEVRNLKRENQNLQEKLNYLQLQQHSLTNKIHDLESRSKRNNIIFKGLQWNGQVDFRNIVAKFCVEVMGCNDKIWVNRAHPLGDSKIVIAHFPTDSDIDEIMANTGRLRGTGYVVHRDYTVEVRKKRAVLTQVKNEIIRVCGKRRMPLVFDHLYVENCKFTWENDSLKAGKSDGGAKLLALLGRDFTAFINRLGNKEEDTRLRHGSTAVATTGQGGKAASSITERDAGGTVTDFGGAPARETTAMQQSANSYVKVATTREACVNNTQVPASQG